MQVTELNKIFTELSPIDRIRALYRYFEEEEVLFTSSFGTNAVFMLHLIHQVNPEQAVHFIDTGYHFQETLDYKAYLTKRFDLKVVDLKADPQTHHSTYRQQLWSADPDKCCDINKIQLLDEIKGRYKVWVSGLMGYQTTFRSGLDIFERQDNMIKFHPLIGVTKNDVEEYIFLYRLPKHPLLEKGYDSVGCTHCTLKGKGRDGRWKGREKSECGLHPDRFSKKSQQNTIAAVS